MKLSSGLLPARRRSSEEIRIDPIVGAGAVVDPSPEVFARGWAYVGGFGIASDLTADLFAGFGYRSSIRSPRPWDTAGSRSTTARTTSCTTCASKPSRQASLLLFEASRHVDILRI